MLELNPIAEFSRCHCVGICALLVPANIGLASATIFGIATDRSPKIVYMSICLGSGAAVLLLLHVATWLSIGVVISATFILPAIALTSLGTYIYAIVNPQHLRSTIAVAFKFSIAKYRQMSEQYCDTL